MNKIIITLLISTIFAYAKLNTVVSILPQQTFLKAIGGDKINISLMVKPGNSPHTYEPKPSQMIDISHSDIYFAIGVEFENIWLSKFKNQNKSMKIIDISNGINKIHMDEDNHHKHHKDHVKDDHDSHEEESTDPHIWTSPNNVKIIAKNIYNTLVKYDNKNQLYYKTNLDKFIKNIENTDTKIKDILKNLHNAKFMVFHPSWGYFAKQYNLVQFAIEIEGKKPKPRELIALIKIAKKENVKAIFVSPEFSHKIAQTIANELNIEVKKVSPLNPKWSQNLIDLAKAIAK